VIPDSSPIGSMSANTFGGRYAVVRYEYYQRLVRKLEGGEIKYRKFQREVIEKILESDKRFIFVDAPTGSGKTLIALTVGLNWSFEYGLPFVSFVRTRSQLSSFVRDYWKFLEVLPRVFLAKSVMCRRFRGSAELEDFERLPSCSRCSLRDRTLQSSSRVLHEVSSALGRGIYDPYAMNYPARTCPYVWWDSVRAEDLPVAPVVATYTWLFSDWLFSVFQRRVGEGFSRVVGVVDEAHNLDEFVVDRLAGVSCRTWEVVLKRCSRAVSYIEKHGQYRGLFKNIERTMVNLCRLCGRVSDSQGIVADRHMNFVLGLRRVFRSLLPVRPALESLFNVLVNKADEYLRSGDGKNIELAGEYYVLGRFIGRLGEFLDNFENWLNGNDEYVRCLVRPTSVSIISVHTGNIYKKISERLDRGLFISGTLPPKEYVVDVWGFPEDEVHYERVVLRGFGKVSWKVVKGVTSKYTRRGSKMYRLYAGVIVKECRDVDGVCLVAFPSYQFLRAVSPYLSIPGVAILEETRHTKLGEVYKAVKKHGKVALLVTMGGKFVEGVELVDGSRSLIRKVVVVGVPYENPSELADEIIKANKLDRWLFINVRAYFKVRQALGRAIRFESDRATFVLCDDRYLGKFWKDALLS